MLRRTGERPERIAEMRAILGRLGLGSDRNSSGWIYTNGVFDHGEMFSIGGIPRVLVGHPYGIDADEYRLLAELRRFTVLRVGVDDRPSYYGFGSNHVRVELAEPIRPFAVPWTTRATRAYKRAARKALAEAFAG